MLDGGNNGAAYAVNNRGQVAGQSEIDTPDLTCGPTPPPPFFIFLETRAVIWQNATPQQLATLPNDTQANALAINDLGQAVGVSGDCFVFRGGFGHAVLWQNGVMTDLGTLPGDVGSFAPGINNLGQATGGSFDADFNVHAFLWENGAMTDLNTLIPTHSPLSLLIAFDINSLGQIVGAAFVTAGPHVGEVHAFLATPVPGGNPHASPKLTLPDSVRKQLQKMLSYGRFKRGLIESP